MESRIILASNATCTPLGYLSCNQRSPRAMNASQITRTQRIGARTRTSSNKLNILSLNDTSAYPEACNGELSSSGAETARVVHKKRKDFTSARRLWRASKCFWQVRSNSPNFPQIIGPNPSHSTCSFRFITGKERGAHNRASSSSPMVPSEDESSEATCSFLNEKHQGH